MRFGLVGTGPWALKAHGPGLVAAPGVELVGVWGRSPQKAQTLADQLDVSAYDDLDRLFDDVDAVAFAVPPDVQPDLALRAARAGKHLLLEKPIPTMTSVAQEVASEATSHGCSAVVLFTDRFLESGSRWLREVG